MTINSLLDNIQIELQKSEWVAWQQVVAHLKFINIDINEQDKLAQSIEAWGKEYHKLKRYQEKFPA
jgi:hypothetical protein